MSIFLLKKSAITISAAIPTEAPIISDHEVFSVSTIPMV